jgi:hypothetical protein
MSRFTWSKTGILMFLIVLITLSSTSLAFSQTGGEDVYVLPDVPAVGYQAQLLKQYE